MSTLFCRHNRFTADCPICSRGTVLDASGGSSASRSRPAPAGARRGGRAGPSQRAGTGRFAGPYAEAGPFEDHEGASYRVRLERVPGGLRLGEWVGGELRRRAPVLPGGRLRALVSDAAERSIPRALDADRLLAAVAAAGDTVDGGASHGASPGRAGELRDELRVEGAGDGLVRVARWILRPGTGWERRDAPPMLPAERYAEALQGAARAGVLGPSPPPQDPLSG